MRRLHVIKKQAVDSREGQENAKQLREVVFRAGELVDREELRRQRIVAVEVGPETLPAPKDQSVPPVDVLCRRTSTLGMKSLTQASSAHVMCRNCGSARQCLEAAGDDGTSRTYSAVVHRDPGVLALVVDPELSLVEDVHAQAVLGDEV